MIERTPRGRTLGIGYGIAALSVLAVCLTSCAAPSSAGTPPPAVAASSSPPPSTPAPAPTAEVDVPVTSSELTPAEEPTAPVQLVVAGIDVDMPVIPVGVDDTSQMELPEDPAIAGWYRFGPDYEADQGHIVMSAHVDSPDYPIGPLARLRELSPGAEAVLMDDTGQPRDFVIESITYYQKTALPVDEIFRRDGDLALILITCGGPFDSSTGRYRDNVVAVALPADAD